MIQVLYFGKLAEELNCFSETLTHFEGNAEELLSHLRARGQHWENSLKEDKVFKMFVNHAMAFKSTPIPAGAEVAILPPVTGG